jgi:antibiotic biosynthesis monooxygenase (ABM) superfamily enzyme
MPEKDMPVQESEVVRRCRKARQELFARFKTPEEMHAWLMSREKEAGPRRGLRVGKAQARRQAKPAPRNGKPVHAKPVHKA